jgi:hypothetical protein
VHDTAALLSVRARRQAPRLWGRVARGPAITSRPDLPVRMSSILNPLRLDLWIRLDFYRFLDDARERGMDATTVVAEARRHPYRRWFERVVCAKFAPELLADPASLDEAFVDRVNATANLMESVRRSGWDEGHPVVLRSGQKVLRSRLGRHEPRSLYPGDGCHRLALRLYLGQQVLEAGQYEVKRYLWYRPVDNTSLLLEEADERMRRLYAEHLAFVYDIDLGQTDRPDRAFGTLMELHRSSKLPREMDEVMEQDLRTMGRGDDDA